MPDSPLAQALAHHQAGRLGPAEMAYAAHLAAAPGDSEARHLLGVLRHQQGRTAEGRELIRAAIALAPSVGAYHANLGILEAALGDSAAAVAAFDRACALAAAITEQIRPMRAAANLAAGDHARAEADYSELVSTAPEDGSAWRGLALARHARGDAGGALPAYRRAVALMPEDVAATNGLGAALLDTGSAGEALAVLERAAASAPPWGPLLANLGNARRATGDARGAVEALRRALACDPENATTLANLAAVLSEEGVLGEAAELCRQALRIAPDDAAARSNLAACLFDAGDVAAAVGMWRENAGDPRAGSNALYALNFLPASSRASLHAAAREWAALHAHAGPATHPAAFANTRDRDRRLRVGLVSPDLRSHSVAWFLLPVLEALDGAAVEIHAFAELPVEDPITARIREHVAAWHPTAGQSDGAMTEAIRAAGIDVLVDLAGHTAGSRLAPFARRAAPVQMSWLGYPEVTGIDAIDWRITDNAVDPPGTEAPGPAGERPLRLASGFHAYRLPEGAPDVQPRTGSGIVFGSFNNWPKHSPDCLSAWAEILGRVPDARLILKNKAMGDPATRAAMRAFFAGRGVDPDRIDAMVRVSDPRGHLALYGLVDIALDPFPYNGVTTTCEALSMGVPVVALRGTTSAGRVGSALLERVGCPELVADTRAAYIARAVELAGDRRRLATYRVTLRDRVAGSPLGDPAKVAQELVAAIRMAWTAWCRENPAG
jgi:predicted O-linked N-acetylglucosamine transferase (SPINDLY family)